MCPLCKIPFTRITKSKNGENLDYALIKNWEDENTNTVNPNVQNPASKS